MEEVNSRSAMKQYKLAKNGVGVVRYLRSVHGSGSCGAAFQTGDWLSLFVEG